ncbi:DedA family protein [Arcanobacterium pinnipediorum]|uniref:VTT domain-containing protein n=1 Tax=Arcanobacterium pinnipediorum TaxID=1503041 RepID=A0ABY5AIM1_9ACTO|nr:VTT domain-containing protein [Arcanobacterium pinnipediorum]USR80043.1 VTT domain-containing protein [Arcanobacterium pinnipediorum]
MSSLVSDISTFVSEGPLLAVFLFLCVVIFFRAQGTYWLGRYITYVLHHRVSTPNQKRASTSRFARWLESERVKRGVKSVQERGWPIITFSFLTVGFQTIANLAAGILRMPWPKYTAAMIPGGIAWAGIYSTIGWAVWKAAVLSATQSWWGPLLIIILLGLYGIFFLRRKRAGDDIIYDDNSSTLGNEND